ncbi:MAG: SDR family oxidoreductase [Rubricoccaceae bacterium]|nr:SDR family oxidoreductase [Rubricoccaceae bacterium]
MSTTNGKQEVVVITGASAGVGRAVAREFARHGARIGLIARGEAGLDGARRDVERLGGTALVLPCDVADAAAVEDAAARVERELGPIDVWVNNAMQSVLAPFKEMTADDFRRVTEVTYLGVVHGTMAALRRMLPRDRGTVVQVGSALAYRSIPLQSAYCGAKHAIVGFTDSIRCELVHDGSNVHVTAVHLPALNTPQFRWVKSLLPNESQPVPPIFQPEVAARAIYRAAHADKRELWVGLPAIQAIVGQKLIPGLLDVYLGKTGYDGQQTDEPRQRSVDEHNLWHPLDQDEDRGAHGAFDEKAHGRSVQQWADRNTGLLAAGAALVGVVAALASRR